MEKICCHCGETSKDYYQCKYHNLESCKTSNEFICGGCYGYCDDDCNHYIISYDKRLEDNVLICYSCLRRMQDFYENNIEKL